MDKELIDLENTSRLEIAAGVSFKAGDTVIFYSHSARVKIIEAFVKHLSKPNLETWIETREHVEGGILQRIDFSQMYYYGPTLVVDGLYFPLAIVEYINGEKVNWPE